MSLSKDFLAATLNVLTDQIAVIDKSGNILFVNNSWRLFAKDNDLTAEVNWEERNYLDVCNVSASHGDSDALEAQKGISEVLNGGTELYVYEYPCHCEREKRWFLMRASPFEYDGGTYAVISHTNITKRKLAEEHAMQLSRLDSLTNLANRRYFNQLYMQEWNRCTREQAPITLAILDIDYFKLLNDNYGHNSGDDCLKSIGEVLLSYARRPNDICCRYGGDEFVLAYGNTTLDEALVLVLKLMDEIRHLEIPNQQAPTGPYVTVSAGLATIYPEMESDSQSLIRAADRLLYVAKDSGRDSIEYENLLE